MVRGRRRVLMGLAAVVAAALSGCSHPPPKTVPVQGKLVNRSGAGVASANLQFIPTWPGADPVLVANATTSADGSFTLHTYLSDLGKALDGAVAGKYKVTVQGYPGGTKIPDRYATAKDTPLEADVPEAGNSNLVLQLETP